MGFSRQDGSDGEIRCQYNNSTGQLERRGGRSGRAAAHGDRYGRTVGDGRDAVQLAFHDLGAITVDRSDAPLPLTGRRLQIALCLLQLRLSRSAVLFVGAGEMIELVATHFAARKPKSMVVSNRTLERYFGSWPTTPGGIGNCASTARWTSRRVPPSNAR